MTKTEIKELRKSLIGQQSDLMDDVGRHGIASGIGAELIADENERADRVADEMVEYQLGNSEAEQLKDIASALAKMDSGNYGICEECKEEIYIERLRARPFSALCIGCQSQKEKVASGMF